MMNETDTTTLQQKKMNQGVHTRLRVITTSLQSQKSSTTGSRRQDLLAKYLYLWIRIFIQANIKNKHGTFEAND